MAEEISKSELLKRIAKKDKGALKKAKNADPKARGRMLPGGIRNGVAKLASYSVRELDDGSPMITITGIAVEPDDCHGMRVNISHFLNENEYATFEENLENFCADLQLLGINTPDLGDDFSEYIAALEEAIEEHPYFLYNTKTKKNGNTAVYLQGLVDDGYTPETDVDIPDADGATSSKPARGKAKPAGRGKPAPKEEPEEPELDVDSRVQVEYEGEWYAGVITECDDDGATITFDDGSEDTVAWADIQPEDEGGGDDDGGDDAEAADDDWEPEVDGGYSYKPPKSRATLTVYVTKVNKRKKTVECETEDQSKQFSDVPWDELGEA